MPPTEARPVPSARGASAFVERAKQIGRDPLSRAGLAYMVLLSALYVGGFPDRETLARWSGGFALLPLAIWAALATNSARRRSRNSEARRYWGFLSAASSSWSAAISMTLLPSWHQHGRGASLAYDVLITLSGTLFVLATTTSPHKPGAGSKDQVEHWLVYTGAAVFGGGMLVYFDLLPFLFDSSEFDRRLPAYLLFLALDVAFLLRAFLLFVSRRRSEWRVQYGALLLTSLAFLIGDSLDAAAFLGQFSYQGGWAWDFAWYLMLPPLALAAGLDLPRDRTAADPAIRRLRSPLLTFVVLVPLIHFSLAISPLSEPHVDKAHQLTALATMLLLLAIASALESRLARRNRALEEEVRRARMRISSAERLESLGRLAGGIAHQLNNDLAVIQGYNEALLALSERFPEAAEPAQSIESAVAQSAKLTAKLLAVGQRRLFYSEATDVDATVRRLLPRLEKELGAGIRLNHSPSERSATANIDPEGLEYILLSLAENSADALTGGGTFAIRTQLLSIGFDELPPGTSAAPGSYVQLEVEDDGPGVSSELLEKLFEPFVTTHRFGSGRGLGLASIRGIVEQCGGFVTLRSSPGRGFGCSLHFPATFEKPSGIRRLSIPSFLGRRDPAEAPRDHRRDNQGSSRPATSE
ncbi:MAG: ATP-binding protein [Thermoanaerobaculia bacterium]